MIISKQQFLKNKKVYIKKIKQGSVFIYPTDTIYGIGCISTNKKSINRIKEIKQRTNKPFSIIVPSKNYILKKCKYNKNLKKHLKKLPGKYTLILELKNKKLSPNKINTIGVRIPKHWFSKIVKEINLPIITTSVNISNNPYMTSLKDLSTEIKSKVDFIIYQGHLNNKPSKIINLITNQIIKRE
ncbi:threonylcarbamoyl-AMP synthase [Candidatus Woesearchaeota archaeon]|nr:threonylcarbamoyl-AMP synthase [Candidatus Woesearchaeota archaeon]